VKLELGRTQILDGLDFELEPGCHCAVVGPSGAGKSSLLGLLLGWHRPSEGRIEFDGRPLDATQLARLRETTAWVDPQVQLWNRSLVENLRYGARGRAVDLTRALEATDLRPAIDKLPEGLSTALGEGGGVLSEGERQRVRLARALSRGPTRLVLLDEPFRGLNRATRARYFAQLRRWWSGSTVLCVTHDIGETLGFDRVMVIDGGRIVEQGSPAELAQRPDSVYRAMLDAEQGMRAAFDEDPGWVRWRMQDGRLSVSPRRPHPQEG
jgi:ABC-type multidrug transport system fused ATPase/permease subunit